MATDQQLLVLAALLHDIGKFAQRAGRGKNDSLEGEYCPHDKSGRPSHLHVLYTDYFIENDIPLPKELEGDRSRLSRLASSHHRPAGDDLLEWSISRGDSLSAGSDRLKEGADTGDYKSARLVSVFDQVRLKGAAFDSSDAGKLHYYRLMPIEKGTFPTSLEEARKTGYDSLFDEFARSMAALPLDMGVRHYTDSLISLMEKYTWCIPSNTWHSLPDISLYDHSLSTAAIAQALHAYHAEKGGLPGEGRQTLPKFVLFGGDLSGIQRYIFGLDKSHGAGVAKLFRARSFLLQAITRSVVIDLLNRLKLSPVARIMDAGGRFVLLLPATGTVRLILPQFEEELQRWFLNRFGAELSLVCSFKTELTEEDLELCRFRDKLDEMNDHLDLRKKGKFDRVMGAGASPYVELGDFGEDGDCKICHKRPADGAATTAFAREQGRTIEICEDCYDQITMIGRRLPDPNTRFAVYRKGFGAGQAIRLFGEMTLSLERDVTAVDEGMLEIANLRDRSKFSFQPVAGHLPVITDEDLVFWRSHGLVRTEGDRITLDGEEAMAGMPKTFQMLALASKHEFQQNGKLELRGKAFLGALKADVDNLGFIFSIGLRERLSVSRFSGLSRMLNHFFSEYLIDRIKAEFHNIYVVFAGGDDLFLLGPWTDIVRFGKVVSSDFARFTASNGEITLSAGISVVKPALPVQTIARLTEETLEESKGFTSGNGKRKNAVTLFDTTVSWDDFGTLLDYAEWLEGLIVAGKITAGLARRLLQYADDYRAFMGGDMERGTFLSHMAYDFARNLDEKKMKDKSERERFMSIRTDGFLMPNLRLPLSHVFYRLRKD